MEISVEKTEQETIVSLTGELSIYEVQDLRQRLEAVLPEIKVGLRLKLGQIVEADTAGIQFLLGLRQEMMQQGLTFEIAENCEAVSTALTSYYLPETLQ